MVMSLCCLVALLCLVVGLLRGSSHPMPGSNPIAAVSASSLASLSLVLMHLGPLGAQYSRVRVHATAQDKAALLPWYCANLAKNKNFNRGNACGKGRESCWTDGLAGKFCIITDCTNKDDITNHVRIELRSHK